MAPVPKKRKFSDLSVEKTSRVKEIIRSCRDEFGQLGIDDEDKDVMELNRIFDKLTAFTAAFSNVSVLTFGRMGIKILPMEWRSDGETEAEIYGYSTLRGAPTVEDTRKNINDVLKYVSLESEAGCHILINALLIHVASTLETDASGLVIVPEFRVEDMLLGTKENSFGLVDYMLVYGDKAVRNRIIKSKALAFSDPEIYKLLKCNIYGAKPEDLFNFTTSLPQAAMAAIIKAQELQLKTFRGCVTSGKRWVFFVYNENPEHGQGNTVYWLDPIPLGDGHHNSTVNLALILGVLRDWVEHGHDNHLRFFEYSM